MCSYCSSNISSSFHQKPNLSLINFTPLLSLNQIKPAMEQFSISKTFFPGVPLIDLTTPESKSQLVKACEDFGFFKVINHGIPITELESEAVKLFSLPISLKEKAGPPDPFGYGSKKIGNNGDMGMVEYFLLNTNTQSDNYNRFSLILGEAAEKFRYLVNEYVTNVKRMACEILEMLADGLKIQERNEFSKLLMDENSDSVFRLNHYPPCPIKAGDEPEPNNLIGFGEHTDPQIISVLRSNNTSGLQISLTEGVWISVPADSNSFFINVGDSLQVMTNGRFKSVRHRVVTNSSKSRVSMIFFGGPPLSEKIAPLSSLIRGEDESLYKEFTWFEYKKSAYKSRLSDNRLGLFERIGAS